MISSPRGREGAGFSAAFRGGVFVGGGRRACFFLFHHGGPASFFVFFVFLLLCLEGGDGKCGSERGAVLRLVLSSAAGASGASGVVVVFGVGVGIVLELTGVGRSRG